MYYLYHDIDLRINISDRLEFTVCKKLKIERSVNNLTASATLELPRAYKNAVDKNGKTVNISDQSILDFLKRGDSIKIALGYDGDLETEFQGYITNIGADAPLILECEDEMYQLKKGERITAYVESGDVKEILQKAIFGYDIQMLGNYNIGAFLIDDKTPYELLEELKDKADLSFHFLDNKTLKVGLSVDWKPGNEYVFNFSENIREKSRLTFKRKKDRQIKITVKSNQKDGSVNSYSVGESGGDTKTISYPGLSQQECQEWAEKQVKMHSFDGFEGSFDSWCVPRTRPGDSAKLVRPYYEDRHQDGTYFIEGVKIMVDESKGINRRNTISYKL